MADKKGSKPLPRHNPKVNSVDLLKQTGPPSIFAQAAQAVIDAHAAAEREYIFGSKVEKRTWEPSEKVPEVEGDGYEFLSSAASAPEPPPWKPGDTFAEMKKASIDPPCPVCGKSIHTCGHAIAHVAPPRPVPGLSPSGHLIPPPEFKIMLSDEDVDRIARRLWHLIRSVEPPE